MGPQTYLPASSKSAHGHGATVSGALFYPCLTKREPRAYFFETMTPDALSRCATVRMRLALADTDSFYRAALTDNGTVIARRCEATNSRHTSSQHGPPFDHQLWAFVRAGGSDGSRDDIVSAPACNECWHPKKAH
jgi:hypothetical protein